MRNAASTTLITSLLLALVGISLAVSDRVQTRARLDQRLALQADGEANALGGLFTRTRLALRLLADDSAFREGIAGSGTFANTSINGALGSLERAEPGLVGAASAIGLDGRERARVVHGRPAPAAALARDVRNAAFFRATLSTAPGEVHISQPYRSADTAQWVVSNSALVRDDRGAPLGIVRFELALASLRTAAAAALGRERGVRGGARRPRRAGARSSIRRAACSPAARGAEPVYRRLVVGRARPRDLHGRRAASRLPRR